MAHSIPDSFAVALTCELGTTLVTGDYKFDQTPGRRRARRRGAPRRAGPRRPAAAVRGLDQRRPARGVAVGVERGAEARGGVRALPGPHRGHLLRLQHPPRAAGGRRRRGARPQGLAGGPLDAQEREHRPHARPHRRARGHAGRPQGDRGLPRPQAGRDLHRQPGRAALGAAPHGARRPPAGGAARRRHGDLLRDLDPRQRARGERDDQPHLPARRRRDHGGRRARARLGARLPGGAQADAQPDQARVRDAGARRPPPPAPALRAGRGGRRSRPSRSSAARTGCRSRSTRRARASATASRRA